MSEVQNNTNTQDKQEEIVIASSKENHQIIDGVQSYLEDLKTKFANNPLIKKLLNEISNYLNDPKSQRELFEIVSEKTGGIFSFFGKVFSTMATTKQSDISFGFADNVLS